MTGFAGLLRVILCAGEAIDANSAYICVLARVRLREERETRGERERERERRKKVKVFHSEIRVFFSSSIIVRFL